MNKRNTEGYVLVYLLVAITVIGLVASALMASTLNIMRAQKMSLQKMQSKYTVQGEVERFIADLDMIYPSSPIDGNTYPDNKSAAVDSAISKFSDYLNNRIEFPFGNYPLLVKDAHSVTHDTERDFLVIDTVFSDNITTIRLQIMFAPEFTVAENYIPPIEDNPSTPEDESRAGYTNYKCTVNGAKDFSFSSYKITSTGGGT